MRIWTLLLTTKINYEGETQVVLEIGIFIVKKSIQTLDILKKKIYIASYLLKKEHISRSLHCHYSLSNISSCQVKKNLICF